jgi:energy-converting hydrogenase Eha subunit C
MRSIFYMKYHMTVLVLSSLLVSVINCAKAQTNISVSACNAYMLPWNTIATTTSGIYTHAYPKTPNPDSIVNITLTINVGPSASTLTSTTAPSFINLIDEQFDILNPAVTYTPTGWFQTNKSSPLGTTAWFSGPFLSNGTPTFATQSGTGCIVSDYLSTTGAGTISTWLISPTVTMQNGDVLSFYTISNPSTPYADRMEVRMSPNGASTNVGTTATSTGDFTTSLLTINNSLISYAYPQVWTQYTVAISGLSGPTSGKIAFRYFVTSGGPLGANSDMIGLDNVKLSRTSTPVICAGNIVNLKVNTVGGLSPYSVILNNGASNFTTNSYVNNVNIPASPAVNATYSIVSVVDANGCSATNNNGTPSFIVNQPITTSQSVVQCSQYSLPWGLIVSASGTYSNTYIRANGCDSIRIYQVTILNTSVTNLTALACNQYLLPWSSTPVFASGTYTNLYQNAALCDSIVSIQVTIKLPTSSNNSLSGCSPVTLPWGVSVTNSGTFNHTYVGSNSCDSVANITVNILNKSSFLDSVVACNSYLLPWSSTPVTVSGTFTNVYLNAAGCDSTRTIVLLLKFATNSINNISACTSYLLPWSSVSIIASGTYSNTYVGSNNCDSISTIILTINNTNVTTIYDTSFSFYTLPWGTIVNASGNFSNVYQNQNLCDSTVTFIIYVRPPLQLNLKVILGGPFNIGNNLMNDTIRALGLIPISDPYRSPAFNNNFVHVNNAIMQTIGSGVLSVTGNDAIVDWVFIQLHSKFDSSIVVGTKAALVQRDGDVVSAADGVSPVSFSNLINDNYFISIRHRNHLGIISLLKYPISNTPISLDFTNISFPLFQFSGKKGNSAPLSGATRLQNGKRTLYAGNVEITLATLANKFITYNNWTISDRATLLTVTGGTATILGYNIYDTDLNGYARFNGLNPDRVVIFQNCLLSNLTIINEQIP